MREWLISDLIYIEKGIQSVFSGLGGFNIDVLKNHYSAMALTHWKKYCSLEFRNDKTKKYLYVIRSILCWRLLNRGIFPPIKIQDLLTHELINIDDEIKDAVNELIDYHQENGDLSEDSFLKLSNFILDSLSKMKKVKTNSYKNLDDYDEKFRELLFEVIN